MTERPCSIRYLLVLSRDLFTISRLFHTWGSPAFTRAVTCRVFRSLMEELVRIDRNPVLIPSAYLHDTFWTMIVDILGAFPPFEEVESEDDCTNFCLLTELLHFTRAHQNLQCRGVYDFRKTLWQQFLLHMAPGMGGLPPMLPPLLGRELLTKFVVPPAGLEIMRKWETNLEILRMKIFPVCNHTQA